MAVTTSGAAYIQPKPAGRSRLVGLTLAGAAVLLAAGNACAQLPVSLNKGFEDPRGEWKEREIQLPAAPQESNLVEFEVGGSATLRFLIDVSTISIADDGVVRYTLVSRSPSGAQSISYEGLRCESYEKKLYAFGQKDGSWSSSRRDQWDVITGTAANRQHAALAQDYFCNHKVIEGSAKEIADRFRYNRPLTTSQRYR